MDLELILRTSALLAVAAVLARLLHRAAPLNVPKVPEVQVAAVAVIALYLPARRGTRVDPVVTLKAE